MAVNLKYNIRKLKCILHLGRACWNCGYNRCLDALDFHHLPEYEKLYDISWGIKRYPFEHVMVELEKCALLCANCHRETHANLGKWQLRDIDKDELFEKYGAEF